MPSGNEVYDFRKRCDEENDGDDVEPEFLRRRKRERPAADGDDEEILHAYEEAASEADYRKEIIESQKHGGEREADDDETRNNRVPAKILF